jgi:uncharacterized protein YbbC (DUF1343 family)
MLFNSTGLTWVAPSPNLPTAASSLVYPGQVILEGTNLSEGRGTTLPFEVFGAPYVDPKKIQLVMDQSPPQGALLRPMEFEPTSNKWQGRICHGFQLHVTDPATFKPYRTSLTLVQAMLHCHPDQFQWKTPPYEYEYERMPIDLILGSGNLRQQIENMVPVKDLEMDWQSELTQFEKLRASFLLYD